MGHSGRDLPNAGSGGDAKYSTVESREFRVKSVHKRMDFDPDIIGFVFQSNRRLSDSVFDCEALPWRKVLSARCRGKTREVAVKTRLGVKKCSS